MRPLRLARLLLVPALVALALGWAATPASAHSDDGVLAVDRLEVDGTAIHLDVGLVYADDGHLAEEATVTATATSAEGEAVGPVALVRESGGLYTGVIEVPSAGSWTLAVAATDPEAEMTEAIEVTGEPLATEDGATAPTEAATGTAPTTAAPEEAQALIAPTPTTGESENTSYAWVAAIVFLVIVVGVLVAAGVGRRNAPGA